MLDKNVIKIVLDLRKGASIKMKRIFKIILLVVVIISILFVVTTARKVIILTSLKDKIIIYNQNSVVHEKIETEQTIIEAFIKEDMYKTVIQSKEANYSIIHITDYNSNEGRTYFEGINGKFMQIIRNDEFELYKLTPIYTFANSASFLETLTNSIVSKIYTESINDEEFYVIEGKKNTNFVCGEGTIINVKGYINKKTGLRSKMVETIEENGEKKNRITIYEYSFDNITLEDFQEPNRAEYEML